MSDNGSRYYDRDQLYMEVWAEPVRNVSKRYGVSDVALAKTCRKLAVPLPGVGYWAKKQHGKAPEKPPLLPIEDSPKIVIASSRPRNERLTETEQQALLAPEVFREASRLIDIEKRPESLINVLEDYPKQHPLVKHTFSRQRQNKPQFAWNQWNGGFRGYMNEKNEEPILNVKISPLHSERAARILNALLFAFENRGFAVASEHIQYSGWRSRVSIFDQPVDFRLREYYTVRQATKDELKKNPYPEKIHEPTNEFVIETDSACHEGLRRNWRDTNRRRLEDSLNDVVCGMINCAAWMVEESKQREKRQREWEKKEAERHERERLRKVEEARVDRFDESARQWARIRRLRRFIRAVREEASKRAVAIDEHSRVGQWLIWSERYIAENDPLANDLPSMDPPKS